MPPRASSTSGVVPQAARMRNSLASSSNSKIEAGQMVLNRSEFAVRKSLEYCLSLVRERALKQRIRLDLSLIHI